VIDSSVIGSAESKMVQSGRIAIVISSMASASFLKPDFDPLASPQGAFRYIADSAETCERPYLIVELRRDTQVGDRDNDVIKPAGHIR